MSNTIDVVTPFLISQVQGQPFHIQSADKIVNFEDAFGSHDSRPYDALGTWVKTGSGYIMAVESSTALVQIYKLDNDGKEWQGRYNNPLSGMTATFACTVVDDRPYIFSLQDDNAAIVFRVHENGEKITNEGKVGMKTSEGLMCGVSYQGKGLVAQFDQGNLYLYHVGADHKISFESATGN